MKKCPCGYSEECAIHCGYGHYTGDCPPYDATDPRSPHEYTSERLTKRKLAQPPHKKGK